MAMRRLAVSVVLLTLALAGCGPPPDIVVRVKTGTLSSHPTKTIGKTFDAAFPDGVWSAEMTGMGEMYAHFRSMVTPEALEAAGFPAIDRQRCIDGRQHPCRVPVHFQFFLSSDYRTIELMYVEAPDRVVSEAQMQALLGFIYR